MKASHSFRRAKRGQFVILATVMAVILLLSLMVAYSYASVFRSKLIRKDFEETILQISFDFRQSVEAALASASARWRLGYVACSDVGNDFLLSWVDSVRNSYSGLGLDARMEPVPVQFTFQRLINTGRSSCVANLALDIKGYGVYGWRDSMTVEDLLMVDGGSVNRTGDHVTFQFTFTNEKGLPIGDISSSNLAMYMRQEQAIKKFMDPNSVTLTDLGGGRHSVDITTGTLSLITYNIDVLNMIINDMDPSYFKQSSYKSVLISKLDDVLNQVNHDAWNGAYQELANDIRPKLDPADPQTWMNPNADTATALMIVDETLGYMLPTFEAIVFDRRGVVTISYVAFPTAGDTIGPEAEELDLVPSSLATRTILKPGSVDLVALMNDTATGGSNIAYAEYFLGEEGAYGKGIQMSPQDGSFDEPQEWVSAIVSIRGWEVGDYTLYVHGRDARGNWGQTGVIILRIRDLIAPSIANVTAYCDTGLYPEGYSFENGTLGAGRLQVNVTGISDLYRGDASITRAQVRLYNSTFSTSWTDLSALDGAFDEVQEDAAGQIDLVGLGAGLYTLHARATDGFGNQGHMYLTVNVTPDNVGPVMEQAQLSTGTTYGEPVNLTARARDIGNAGYIVQVIQYMIRNATYQSGWLPMNATDGSYNSRTEAADALLNVAGLAAGNYTVTVRAVDSGGNMGGAVDLNLEIKVDTFGPEVLNLQTLLDTVRKALNVSATVSDLGRGSHNIASAQCRLHNSTFGGTYDTGWLNMNAADGAYDEPEEEVTRTIDVASLSEDRYTVEVGAQDSLGNKANNKTVSLFLEFRPPTVYAVDYRYNPIPKTLDVEANVTDEGYGGSNITSARCRLYNATYSTPWIDMTAIKGSFNIDEEVRTKGTVGLVGLSSGMYDLEIEGYDSAGNRGNLTIKDIRLDLEGPDIRNLTAQHSQALNQVNVTALVSDVNRGNSTIVGAYSRITGHGRDTGWLGMNPKDEAYDSTAEYVECLVSTAGWPLGQYNVEVRGQDSGGNIGNSSARVLVGEWLLGWEYRKTHQVIGSTAGPVTNYPVRITVHNGLGTDGQPSPEHLYLSGKGRADFGDLRFTGADGKTLLDYWVEYKVDSDYAVVWVNVPSIPASPDSTSIYAYYGNSSATSLSDITKVLSSTYTKRSISAGWTPRVSGTDVADGDDVGSWQNIGFNFPFWRDLKSRVYVCSNGFGIFDPTPQTTDASNTLSELRQRWMIAPFWDDLRTDRSGGVVTTPGAYVDRYSDNTVITWEATMFGSSSTSIQFQAILYRNGDVRFNIGSATNFANFTPTLGISRGDGANYIDITSERGTNKSWLFTLRNYVSPEPSHGTWGPEESYAG